jgi:hypothetical protein
MIWLSVVMPWSVSVVDAMRGVPVGLTAVAQLTVAAASGRPPSEGGVPVSPAPASDGAPVSCAGLESVPLDESVVAPLSAVGLVPPLLLLQPTNDATRQALLSAATVKKSVRFCMRTMYPFPGQRASKRRPGQHPDQACPERAARVTGRS